MTTYYLEHEKGGGRPFSLVSYVASSDARSREHAEWDDEAGLFLCGSCPGEWALDDLRGLLCDHCGSDLVWQSPTFICVGRAEHRFVLATR